MSRWCDHGLKPAEGKMLAGMFECVHCGTWVKERPTAPRMTMRDDTQGDGNA